MKRCDSRPWRCWRVATGGSRGGCPPTPHVRKPRFATSRLRGAVRRRASRRVSVMPGGAAKQRSRQHADGSTTLPEGRFALRGARYVVAAGNGRAIRTCGSSQIGDSIRLVFLPLGPEKRLSGHCRTTGKNSDKAFSNVPRGYPAGCTECAAVPGALSQAVQCCVLKRHSDRLDRRDESSHRNGRTGTGEMNAALREHREFRASRGIVASAPWQTPLTSSDSPALCVLPLAVMPWRGTATGAGDAVPVLSLAASVARLGDFYRQP